MTRPVSRNIGTLTSGINDCGGDVLGSSYGYRRKDRLNLASDENIFNQ